MLRKACILLLISALCCPACTKNTETTPTKPTQDKRSQQVTDQAQWVAPLIKPDSIAGFVTFNTAIGHGFKIINGVPTTQKVDVPLTYTTDDGGSWAFHIEGTFAFIKAIKGQFPSFGEVNTTIKVEGRWTGDVPYHKLKALVRHTDKTIKPGVFLVIGSPESKSVPLDFYFIGPIQESDQNGITELVTLLLQKPVKEWSAADKEAFAKSANPWIQTLALPNPSTTTPSEQK